MTSESCAALCCSRTGWISSPVAAYCNSLRVCDCPWRVTARGMQDAYGRAGACMGPQPTLPPSVAELKFRSTRSLPTITSGLHECGNKVRGAARAGVAPRVGSAPAVEPRGGGARRDQEAIGERPTRGSDGPAARVCKRGGPWSVTNVTNNVVHTLPPALCSLLLLFALCSCSLLSAPALCSLLFALRHVARILPHTMSTSTPAPALGSWIRDARWIVGGGPIVSFLTSFSSYCNYGTVSYTGTGMYRYLYNYTVSCEAGPWKTDGRLLRRDGRLLR